MKPPTCRLLAAALLAGALPLSAQPPADAPPVPLEEMEVRALPLPAAPATVTRIQLDSLPAGQDDLAGFAAQAPNFSVASNGARSFNDVFALRGLTNTPIFGEPSVTVYLDSLPLGSGFTFPSDLAGFATGELHRGPGANTEFGRAGPAGVLQFSTPAAPPAGSAQGEVRASAGNFNARSATAETAATSAGGAADALVVAGYAARDGTITNTLLDRTIDGQDSWSTLARLRYRPAPAAELTLLFTGQRARDGVQPLVPLGGPLFTVSRPAEGQTDLDSYATALTAAFALPAGRLSATTSFTDWALGPYSNVLVLAPPVGALDSSVILGQRLWSEELKFTGDEKADVRWSGGAFLSNGRTAGTVGRFIPAFFSSEASSYRIGQDSLAAYGEAALKAGNGLTLTPGLRLEGSWKTFDRTEIAPVPGAFRLHANSAALLPKLAADYELSPRASLFASIGAGYKPGGFSSFTASPVLAAFGPERTTAFEVGATRTSADRTLTGTARVFWYDITGYQIERSFTAADYLVVNAPRARSRGAELELTWRPADRLRLTSGVGYTDVTLLRFTDPFTGTSYAGNRPPDVPVFTANLRLEYRDPRGWFAGVGVTATGRVYYSEAQDPSLMQSAYGLLNARFGWEDARWRVALYGNNLLDQAYYSAMTPLGGPGSDHGTPGAPRTYGVEVTRKF